MVDVVVLFVGDSPPPTAIRTRLGLSESAIVISEVRAVPRGAAGEVCVHEALSFDRLRELNGLALETYQLFHLKFQDALRSHEKATLRGLLVTLFANQPAASQRLCRVLKLADAVRRVGAKSALLCGDARAVRAISRPLQSALTDIQVITRNLPGDIAQQKSLGERCYTWIAGNAILAGLSSVVIEIFNRLVAGSGSRTQPNGLLVEASSRAISYIEATRNDPNSPPCRFIARRYSNIHLGQIRRKWRDFQVDYFVDHSLFRPFVLLVFFASLLWATRRRLRATALAMLTLKEREEHSNRIFALMCAEGERWPLLMWQGVRKAFMHARPKAVLLAGDFDAFQRVIVAYARSNGIPVSSVQHGVFTEPLSLDGFEVDNYFVWGEASRDFLIGNQRTRPRIHIVGGRQYASAEAQAEPRPCPDMEYTVLYATRANSREPATYYPDREEDFLDLLAESWPREKVRVTLVIKPHPRANSISWYRRMANEFMERTRSTAIVSTENLLQEMDRCDLVITTGGSAVLEAVVKKRSCILIVPPGRTDEAGWSKFPLVTLINPEDQPALPNLLQEPSSWHRDFTSPSVAAERSAVLDYFLSIRNERLPTDVLREVLALNLSSQVRPLDVSCDLKQGS